MQKYWLILISFISVLSMLLSGCAFTEIHTTVKRPARIDMTPYPTVGVWEFVGEGGELFTSELNQALSHSGRFKVVNHAELEKIVREQGLAVQDPFDPKYAVELGKILGTSAVVSGRIDEYSYQERVKEEEKEETYYEDGVAYTRTVFVYTRFGTATVTASINVTDLEKAKILTTRVLTETETASTRAVDNDPPPINPDLLFKECRERIVREFMKEIAPWDKTVNVTFFRGDGSIEFGGVPEFESGIGYAKINRWKEAADIFKKGLDRLRNSPDASKELIARAWYNYAVALCYKGDFGAAKNAFGEAIRLQPDPIFERALARCKEDEKAAYKLRKQNSSANFN